jgi:hypothetical protein
MGRKGKDIMEEGEGGDKKLSEEKEKGEKGEK